MQRIKIVLYFGLLSFLMSFSLSIHGLASDWPTEWTDAKNLYDQGKYPEALDAFRQSVAANPSLQNGPYFYNLGNLFYRLEKYGVALAHYEKAIKMLPHHSDVLHNLNLTKQKLGNLKDLDPSSTFLEKIADRIPLEEVRGLLGLVVLFSVFICFKPYLKTRDLKRTFRSPTGKIALFGIFLVSSLYLVELSSSQYPPAVCTEPQTIRSGPGENFLDLGQAQPGVKFRVLGPKSESWVQVRYGESSVGWLPFSSLLVL